MYNNLVNDVSFDLEYQSANGKMISYKDVVIPYKHKVRFFFTVGQPIFLSFKIPKLGYQYDLNLVKPQDLCAVTGIFFGFRDLGNGVSDVVVYKDYATVYPYLTKLVINHMEIVNIADFIATLPVVEKAPEVNSDAGAGRWRFIFDPPFARSGGGGDSDKVGKTLEITSILCNLAGAFDPTGTVGHIQQAVETAAEVNKVYRAVSGKDKENNSTTGEVGEGKFCTSCGAKADKAANFCGKCGKPMSGGSER